MQKYNKKIEDQMVAFYWNLQEKDKRHYVTVEVIKLGYGGIKYILSLLSYTRQIIYKDINELKKNNLLPSSRSRNKGAGRKNCLEENKHDNLRGEYSLYNDNIAYAVLITKDQGHHEL